MTHRGKRGFGELGLAESCAVVVYNHMVMKDVELLNATFAALADPTRRAILARLASGEAIGDGAGRAVRHEPARDLEAPQGAGARRPDRRRARTRSAGRASSKPKPLADAIDWIENYRKHWEAAFARLDEVLEELKAEKKRTTEADRKRKK